MTFNKAEKQFQVDLGLTGREIIFTIAVVLKMIVEILGLTVVQYARELDFCAVVFKIMTYTSYLLVVVSFLLSS